MQWVGVEPDPVTFMWVLNPCTSLAALEEDRFAQDERLYTVVTCESSGNFWMTLLVDCIVESKIELFKCTLETLCAMCCYETCCW
jgi:hypothetical protein